MKTSKLFLSVFVTMTTVCVSATNVNEAESRGVTSAQIESYLVNCSHHHTVSYVVSSDGVAQASIENGKTAYVFIYGNSIIGHLDNN